MAHAGEGRFDLGLWAGVDVADGEPANDIPGFGVQVRYTLNRDLGPRRGNRPHRVRLRNPGQYSRHSAGPVDRAGRRARRGDHVQRLGGACFRRRRRAATTWFVGVGLGAASVDVPDVAGPRADGGQFDIHTEVSTEIIVTGFAGVRRKFGESWYAEFRVHATQHFADWQMEDRVSGAQRLDR